MIPRLEDVLLTEAVARIRLWVLRETPGTDRGQWMLGIFYRTGLGSEAGP